MMRRHVGWWAGLCLLSAAPQVWADQAPADKRMVVIMPFEPVGASQEWTEKAQGYFRSAAAGLSAVRVMGAADTDVAIQLAESTGWRNSLSAENLKALQPNTQADAFVTAFVSTDSGGLIIKLSLFDAYTAQELKRVEERSLMAQDDLSRVMEAAAVEMLQPGSYRGELVLSCTETPCDVIVGTDSVGYCEAALEVPDLLPGTHTLKVVISGQEVKRRVDVRFKRQTVVRVTQGSDGYVLEVQQDTRELAALPQARDGGVTPIPGRQTRGLPTATKDPTQGPPPDDAAQPQLSPLMLAGAGIAVAGAPGILAGLVVAALGAVLSAASFSQRDGDGRFYALPFESNATLVQTRVLLGALVVPVGLGVVLLGGLVLVGGVVIAALGTAT